MVAISQSNIIYPESDGKPMADNTKQFRWIVVIEQNLDWLFADNANVFIAGNLLWYPVEGTNTICQAPDVMAVFGRPKGDRGSYQQWREENIVPQVVFEILSPGNKQTEMNQKLVFYDRYGVEEYYIYDPNKNDLSGWLRSNNRLDVIDAIENWVSPRLGIRFDLCGEELQIFRPDGERFASYIEIAQRMQQAEQRARDAEQRAARLAERLREMGIDPEAME
ncbi:MAG: Uma2 family endonuclease [Hydrococcus sp. Prado102]|jgi:Uma2 family endonuclease|nr:Uma2 family endonuclease [Hydrococcus sp. Prado102]